MAVVASKWHAKRLNEAGISHQTDDGLVIFVGENGQKSEQLTADAEAILLSFDPIEDARTAAIEDVNQATGAARERFVTNIPSQDATYQMKLQDCQKFVADGSPQGDLGRYPFVWGEAQAMHLSGADAAAVVIRTYEQWIGLAALIENIRRIACEEIKTESAWRRCLVIASAAIATLEMYK